jgi:hypothetical protein
MNYVNCQLKMSSLIIGKCLFSDRYLFVVHSICRALNGKEIEHEERLTKIWCQVRETLLFQSLKIVITENGNNLVCSWFVYDSLFLLAIILLAYLFCVTHLFSYFAYFLVLFVHFWLLCVLICRLLSRLMSMYLLYWALGRSFWTTACKTLSFPTFNRYGHSPRLALSWKKKLLLWGTSSWIWTRCAIAIQRNVIESLCICTGSGVVIVVLILSIQNIPM